MKDLILDDKYDLQMLGGDFVLGESTQQHIALHLATVEGEWKQNYDVGFGLVKRARQNQNDIRFKKDLDSHLTNDGFKNVDITMENGFLKDVTVK